MKYLVLSKEISCDTLYNIYIINEYGKTKRTKEIYINKYI